MYKPMLFLSGKWQSRSSRPLGLFFYKRLTFNIVANENNSKSYSYSYGSFQPNLFWMFPVTVITKVTYCDFEISTFQKLKFIIVANRIPGKFQNATFSAVVILLHWNVFWIFPVTVSPKLTCYDFEISKLKYKNIYRRLIFFLTWVLMGVKISNCYTSYSYHSFTTKLFLNVHCDTHHKSYLWGFWISHLI